MNKKLKSIRADFDDSQLVKKYKENFGVKILKNIVNVSSLNEILLGDDFDDY